MKHIFLCGLLGLSGCIVEIQSALSAACQDARKLEIKLCAAEPSTETKIVQNLTTFLIFQALFPPAKLGKICSDFSSPPITLKFDEPSSGDGCYTIDLQGFAAEIRVSHAEPTFLHSFFDGQEICTTDPVKTIEPGYGMISFGVSRCTGNKHASTTVVVSKL